MPVTEHERLLLVLKATQTAVLERNLRTGELTVSPELFQLLGYRPRKHLAEKWLLRAVHPDDRATVAAMDEAGRRGLERPPIIVRLWHRDRRWAALRVTSAVLRDPAGVLRAHLCCVTDITEHERSQEELRRAQRLARLGHWTLDLASNELFWSAETFEVFGLEPVATPLTMAVLQAHVHPDDWPRLDAAFKAHLERQTPFDVRHRIVRADGSLRHVHARCVVERAPSGAPLRALGTVQDVTSMVEAELEVRASHELLQSVIDTAPVRVFWKDRAGVYLGCNQMFALDAGAASHREVVGRTDHELVWRNQAELYREDDRRVCESGLPKLRYEEPQSQSGRTIWLRTSKVPLRSEAGDVIGILGVYEDITAEREAQTSLLDAKQAAERANKARGEFLANMSHELRTPMNAIIGFSDLSLFDRRLPDDVRSWVTNINTSAGELLKLLDDLLDFSRIESGNVELESLAFSLPELLARLKSTGDSLAREKPVEVELEVAAGVPQVFEGDVLRVGRVLVNLLANAVKFTAQGRVTLAVEWSAPYLSFSVTDSGIGMSLEQQSRLFQPFTQADASTTRLYGGTGLGLAITRRLVDLMNGTIAVQSAPGRGSTFLVQLPLVPSDARPAVGTATQDPGATFRGRRALLVEDNRVNQALGCSLLQRLGFEVEVAENGRVALERVLRGPLDVDIVFMDLQMPELDGIETTRELRRHFAAAALPIVAMTANAFESDRQRCLEAGMNGWIPKPLRLVELHRVAGLALTPPS
ncbi:MAG: PAS domain S-box protein [Archangium sp.]|nr:PAS domain S-box protein [Archangium sp.]